jgi:hypothetical protein
MIHNPYTPPQAQTETSPPGDMAPRPVAVSLLIGLLLAFVLMFVITTVQYVATASAHWGEEIGAAALTLTLLLRGALIASFIAVAYCAYRRHGWSRWVGGALLVAFALFCIFRADTTHYDNEAERVGGQVGRLILPVLLGWWAYAITFSSKARRYFSKSPADAA